MRIVFFAAYYHPHIGGYEHNIQMLAESLVTRGHDVAVLTCNSNLQVARENMEGVEVYRVPAWQLLGKTFPVPKPYPQTLRALIAIWRSHPDVISTQTRFFITSFIGWFCGRLCGAKVVHTERGTRHSALGKSFADKLSRIYDHTIGALIVSNADARTAVSDAACEFTNHLSGRDALRVPNGIDATIFDGVLRTERGRIVYVGRLIEAKGLSNLIDAFRYVWETHPESELYIVGDGPYRSELKRQVASLPVFFIGEVIHEYVVRLLKTASVFVNPSFSEGLPTSVMEAAAMGLPVVATDVGGTKEIIEDGVTGLLIGPQVFEIVDALCFMLEHEDEALEMGRMARLKVLGNSGWDDIVNAYEALYKSLSS